MSSKEYSISGENIKLVYFRSYSDFIYEDSENFLVLVSENNNGFTEIYGKSNDIARKLVIIRQSAIGVFRETSPTDFIYSAWEYLKDIFSQKECREFDDIEDFSIALIF